MTVIEVRQYTSCDLDQCRALWTELTQHHQQIYDDPSIGGDDPATYFDKHLAQVGSERIWVAECSGEVLGCVGLIMRGQQAEVEPIVVSRNPRGRGIGRALLDHVVEVATQLGVRFLSVRPVARNVEAIAFLYSSGFRILGHVEVFKDLRPPEARGWKPGPELFGYPFQY